MSGSDHAPAEPWAVGAQTPPVIRPLSLLLIEDDFGDVVLTREHLADSGLANRCDHAASLAEAVAVTESPDCVLLDLNLPDGQGLAALSRVLQRWPDTAVVVLTGLNDTAMGAAAVAAGAQDYLVKNHVDGHLLGRAIQYAVQRRQVQLTERQLRESRLQSRENLRLQRGLLPKPLTTDPALIVASRYVPGQQRSLLGGDFFDVVQDVHGAVHAVIGDVCGNGPDEAAIGVGLRVGWRTLTLAGVGKGERMRLLEQVLVAERPHDAMFATSCTVRISPDRSEAVIVSAGHPPPLIVTGKGACRAPVRSHLSLGMFPGRGRWQETTVSLPPGAGLLLYTDGIYEGFADDGARLGEDRFLDLASRLTPIGAPADYLTALLAEVQRHDIGRHGDDTALLLLTWT
ncbi:PP2C family protein-serine/threonine phosphatase [Actinoplanes couchii]|uniref:Fused response regulator/phosphatase n=1 Tax=Actinoplanes couchii TaxID=403638 RepID=A0ABQ3XTM0_9ACTN|nr:fused response regulator/phosphatase [Actinoplanes couchii]MDR6324123.1 serine phosphatase RsbU (regulator of sigma subunit) [Actinoplanes couchii]GID61858.1 fused response regulator/phosphatase [Actinoplanes couchii]